MQQQRKLDYLHCQKRDWLHHVQLEASIGPGKEQTRTTQDKKYLALSAQSSLSQLLEAELKKDTFKRVWCTTL